PVGEISIINTSKELLQIEVPPTTALDMQQSGKANRQVTFGGVWPMGTGRGGLGSGPPFVKVIAAKSPVQVSMVPAGPAGPMRRPITLAAQTIARRGGILGEALRKSNPQLNRPRRDETVPSGSSDKDEDAVKLRTHLVNLNVSATDRAGRAVPGLKAEDFSVFEDGV